MSYLSVKLLSSTAALFFGTGLVSVYALTEADFTNTGIVESAPTQYENNEANNNSTVLVQPKGLNVTKVADTSAMSSPVKAGDVISYSISLDNIGLLGLTGITLSDTIIPATNLVLASGDLNNDAVLDADETWLYAGTYTVTQEDIDTFGGGDGDIDNTVTVSSNELTSLSDSVEVPVTQEPAFTVAKTVDKASIAVPSKLSYEINITNTGNQSLTGVSLVDTLPDGSVGSLTGPANDIGIANTLDVGESWTYTISYNASQANIDDGSILVNAVSVTTLETGTQAETDNAQTTIEKSPAMVVAKTVDIKAINSPASLAYTITVENTGNVTLNNVQAVDVLPSGGLDVLANPTGDAGIANALDVGETWTFATSYNATQLDVDTATDLVNSVDFTSDETGTDIVSDSATTSVISEPSMSVVKTVDTAVLSAPGSVSYKILVSNTGNVSLNNVTPVDTLPDGTSAILVGPLVDTGLVNQLDVGEVWEYTTEYAVSQTEIDTGSARVNTVNVTSDETGEALFSDSAKTTLTQSPAFSVAKNVDANTITAAGELNYEIQVENTGNVSLSDIVVTDTMPDGEVVIVEGPVADVGGVGLLDVNETWTFVTQYIASQADIDAGLALTNSVSVSTAQVGTKSDTAVTTVSQQPGISISKTSSTANFTTVGDLVSYQFTVINTGNVLLNNIELDDPLVDAGSISCSIARPFSLAPGQQATCEASRTVSASDVSDTQIVNTASVSVSDPAGTEISSDSNAITVPLLKLPPVATDNIVESPDSAVPVTLAGAADDSDPNGDLDVKTVSLSAADAVDLDGDGDNDSLNVAGEGVWLVAPVTGEVTFTPEAGFTADPTPIAYTVSDATGLESNSALLSIDYPQSAPVAEDDYKKNTGVESPDNPTVVSVLADNGSGADSDPENDIDKTSIAFVDPAAIDTDDDGNKDTLVVAGQGAWVVNSATGIVTFTPQAGFLLDPTPIFYTVSDINGLVSNEASITIDYPQTAPVANNDEKLEQALAQPVTVAVVANDTDPEGNLDATSVKLIEPESGNRVTNVTVPDEGVWSVDSVSGDITFTPQSGYLRDPTPMQYTVSDTTELESNIATVTVTFEEPAALEGIVWLDKNNNGLVDDNEDRKAGWTLKVFDSNGQLLGTTVTDEDGYYLLDGLVPGEFTVHFFNENGVYMDQQTTNGPVSSGEKINLPLPVQPGGVVYDSISRLAVGGVTLNMVNGTGALLHPDCLYAQQQSQVTDDDGLYAFNVIPGAHATCPVDSVYRIEIADLPEEYRPAFNEYRNETADLPEEYRPTFSAIIAHEGAGDCGDATLGCATAAAFNSDPNENNCTIDSFPNTNACEVQLQPGAPEGDDDTTYFVEFEYAVNDRNVIFNHLPLDALANQAQLLLSKSADKRQVSIGSLVEYTVMAENTKEVPAVGITVVDVPPANFSLVESSVRMIRAGADGEFDTADDVSQSLGADSLHPLVLSDIDFDVLETIRFKYVMRVGVGAVAGAYVNRASASGPGGEASNVVSSTVYVVPDPVLEQASLIGKVFNDRDSDGSQDPADATGVALRSDYYGWNSLSLPPLPGRDSVNDDPAEHAITVNMPISEGNRFMLLTREGTRISVDGQGTISEAHIGDKAHGFNGQDIRLCTQFLNEIPTDRNGITPEDGKPVDVLQIVIQNYGVNEEGIPGVRLATVTGLLIETDAYGRYSIPDMNAGATSIGQNFVLKVDPATIPQGSRFTTENPYVLRIVNTALNKINFGVHVPSEDPYINGPIRECDTHASQREYQHVEIKLGSVFFDTDKHNIRADQRGIVLDMANKLREYGGGRVLVQAHTDSRASEAYNLALAEKRAQVVFNVLRESLGAELMQLISVEVDPAAYVGSDK